MLSTSTLDVTSEEVRILADLGFLALMLGLDENASALFAGVRAARPDGDAGYIGKALLELRRADAAAAVSTLQQRPPSDANRAFLGLALLRLGEAEKGRAVLSNVATTAREPAFAAIARDTLAAETDPPLRLPS